MNNDDNDYMDHITTPLNACSLEALPEPIVLEDGTRASSSNYWPVVIGCYELQEGEQGGNSSRQGRLALHLIKAPEINNNDDDDDAKQTSTSTRTRMPKALRFGTPHLIPKQKDHVVDNFSGVLDGKWFPKASNYNQTAWWYAAACASGEVRCFQFSTLKETTSESRRQEDLPYEMIQVGSTETMEDDGTLCLSLNWDHTAASSTTESIHNTRIVSSYSDGSVAIHNVAFSPSGVAEFEKQHGWTAHTLFGNTPTQVWTACFAGGGQGRIVLSGGDDCKCKLWDVRCSTCRPAHILQNFDAGVTVVSPHPRIPHVVAVGSYDETMSLYDVRMPSKPMLKESFGGGIWRIQWHPYDDNRLLLAVMHGGCRVVQLSDSLSSSLLSEEESEAPTCTVESVKEFTQHKSMAYGADWLVCKNNKSGYYYEAAASCSFYDKAAYLWDTTTTTTTAPGEG